MPRRFLATLLATAIAIPSFTVAPITVDASTSSALSALEDARDTIYDLWKDTTLPTTSSDIEDYGQEIVDALEEATDELEGVTDEVSVADSLRIRFHGWLTILETYDALDALAIEVFDTEQSDYEDARDDVYDALEALSASIVSATPGVDPGLCAVTAIGSPKAWVDGVEGLMDDVQSELDDVADMADDANTEEEARELIRRTTFPGRIAVAALRGVWRVDNNVAGDFEDIVADLNDTLTIIEEDGRTAIGTSSTLANDLGDQVVDVKTELDDEVDRLLDEDSAKFGSTWRDEQQEIADRIVNAIEMTWDDEFDDTLNDRLQDRAEEALTLEDHIAVRRDILHQILRARTVGWFARIPMSPSEVSDASDALGDIADSTDDLIQELEDALTSGIDGEMLDETDTLLTTHTEDIDTLFDGLMISGSSFSDLPSGDLRDPILDLAAWGVINGTSTTTYTPNRGVTRFEFVKLLHRVACVQLGRYGNADQSAKYLSQFTDGLSVYDLEVRGHIARAVAMGTLRGVPSSSGLQLQPNRPVTRFEAAKILTTFFGTTAAGSARIDDASGEVLDVTRRAIAAGLFSAPSAPSYRFRPNDSLSRAEAAKILFNALVIAGVKQTTITDSITVDRTIFRSL